MIGFGKNKSVNLLQELFKNMVKEAKQIVADNRTALEVQKANLSKNVYSDQEALDRILKRKKV